MVKHQYILLKGIHAKDVDEKYAINTRTTIDIPRTNISDLTTVLSETTRKTDLQNYVFLDEARNNHTYIVTMKNLIDEWLPATTEMCCFWCRHQFSYVPIGCPIQYIPHRLEKKIPSDYKDDVIIRENISKSMFRSLNTDLHNSFINKECFFRVDGVFCSFPCCLAFIQQNKNDTLYRYSENLLRLMHRHCFPGVSFNLCPAPSWRLLKSYGGEMDIHQFREAFINTDFVDHVQHIYRLPMQKMTGFLFEQQIKI